MAKDFARSFYASALWKKTRSAYARYRYGLCERCGRPGDIVHHKIYLTPENITNDAIALGFDNLEMLCIVCHNREHDSSDAISPDLYFDEDGNICKRGGVPPM